MNYISLIEELKKRGSIPGLDAIQGLLEELGHPEDDLKIVHIAGTNGKGSVFAYLSSILMAAGFKVGRYISPTISCYEERFQINGTYIAKDKLERLYGVVEEAMRKEEAKIGLRPTLFEVETALSFLYFKEEKVDYALVEVGMGGRLDATNEIKHPELTVISSISYDHKAILGDTLEEIACQKAGIIKESAPVVLSENPEEVCKVVKHEAAEKKVHCIEVKPQDYEILAETPYGSTFLWKEQQWIGVAPFAAHKGKIYPKEQMEKTLTIISDRHPDARILMFGGGRSEMDTMAAWRERNHRLEIASRVLGGIDKELILMSHLDVMLSMDSSNMHLASLVGTPVVSVWGATHPYAGFMGWGQSESNAVMIDMPCRPCSIYGNKICAKGDYPCLTGITPEQIAGRVDIVLLQEKRK